MKIDKRFAPVLNALLMAIVLPFFMTFVVSAVNIGFTGMLIGAWMRTWAIASAAAFPLIILLAPLIKKVVGRITA
jgi:hypothetical protein